MVVARRAPQLLAWGPGLGQFHAGNQRASAIEWNGGNTTPGSAVHSICCSSDECPSEMRRSRVGNQRHFEMKAHGGGGANSGVLRGCCHAAARPGTGLWTRVGSRRGRWLARLGPMARDPGCCHQSESDPAPVRKQFAGNADIGWSEHGSVQKGQGAALGLGRIAGPADRTIDRLLEGALQWFGHERCFAARSVCAVQSWGCALRIADGDAGTGVPSCGQEGGGSVESGPWHPVVLAMCRHQPSPRAATLAPTRVVQSYPNRCVQGLDLRSFLAVAIPCP